MDNLISSKALVYHNSPNFTLEPKSKFVNCRLNTSTLMNLQAQNMTFLFDIQTYGIPAMLTGRNVILVSHGYTGKSTSYVIFLCSWLIENIPRMDCMVMAPSVIIVCPFSRICENVKNLFKRIGSSRGVIVASQMNEDIKQKLFIEMLDCCNILICTPNSLQELMNVKDTVNLERVRYLVTESTDVLHERFRAETESVTSIIEKHSNTSNLRKIHVADRWCPYFKNTAIKESDTSLIMTAFEEAAIACNLQCVPYLTTLNKRMKNLIDAVRENIKNKPVVACCKAEQVDLVKAMITSQTWDCRVFALSGPSMSSKLGEISSIWSNDNYEKDMVMICTDKVLKGFPVTNSGCLIHFSLPKKKRVFSFRFIVLRNICKNIIEKGIEAATAKIYLVETEENFIQSYMWSFKEKFKIQLSDKLYENYEMYMKTDVASHKPKLCPQIKKFGYCNEHCSFRHNIISKLDGPLDKIPKCGFVKMGITHIVEPNHFCCRLTHYSQSDGTLKKLKQDTLLRKIKIKEYLSCIKNRIRKDSVKVGDIMGIAGEDTFHRVRILKVFTNELTDEEGTVVRVRYVDIGKIDCTKIGFLWSLPNDIKNMPEEAIDVYITGLWPLDKGISWDQKITDGLIENLNSLSFRCETFTGKIKLSLGEELWVDDMRVEKHLKLTNTNVIEYSVKYELLRRKLALKNENHLNNLYELCERAGISCSIYRSGLLRDKSVERKTKPKLHESVKEERIQEVEKTDVNEQTQEELNESRMFEMINNLCRLKLSEEDELAFQDLIHFENLNSDLTSMPENTDKCNGTDIAVSESKRKSDRVNLEIKNKVLNGEVAKKKDQVSSNAIVKMQTENIFPPVTWKQKEEYIYIYVSIVDIKDHYLKCECRRLIFRALNYQQSYFFDIELFGGIIPGDTKVNKNGFQFALKLRKLLIGVEWSRLVRSEVKIPCIKRALDDDVTEIAIVERKSIVHKREENETNECYECHEDESWINLEV